MKEFAKPKIAQKKINKKTFMSTNISKIILMKLEVGLNKRMK